MHGEIHMQSGFDLEATKQYFGPEICQLPALQMSNTTWVSE